MKKNICFILLLGWIVTMGAIFTPVSAQDIDITEKAFFPQTSDEFIQALKPQKLYSQSRGISLQYQNPPTGEVLPKIIEQTKETPAVNLRINFAFNSAKLDETSKFLLYELSKALNSEELAAYQFSIVGHTDIIGPHKYNQSLSEKRAYAVRRYLFSQLGVEGKRLSTEGHGEENLLDPHNPKSHVNRRVEIMNRGVIKNTVSQ